MITEIVGAECVVGGVEVESVVVQVLVYIHILTNSTSLARTRSSQLCLLWSGNRLVILWSLNQRNDMPVVMQGVWRTSAST